TLMSCSIGIPDALPGVLAICYIAHVVRHSWQRARGYMSDQSVQSHLTVGHRLPNYQKIINEVCDLSWEELSQEELVSIAWVYYYFSIQFRENLEIARSLYPDDVQLQHLDHGERDTDNLSPWPGVAAIGERMNHDEFMRRTLKLTTIEQDRRRRL